MVRNNGRSLVDVCATYGTLSLRIDYQPPSQNPVGLPYKFYRSYGSLRDTAPRAGTPALP